MDILDLPPDTIIYVFSYLHKRDLVNSVRKTCKLWHALSYERRLWKRLHINEIAKFNFCTRTFIEMISASCDSVEELHMDLKQLDKNSVMHGEVFCSNLKEITLYWEHLRGTKSQRKDYTLHCHDGVQLRHYLPGLSNKYPNLKSLHLLSHVVFIKDLLPLFRELEELEIEYADFSFEDVEAVTEAFFDAHQCIKHLSIRFSVFDGKALSFILSNVSGLKTLDLSNSNFNCDDVDMSSINQNSLEILKLTNTRSNDRLLRCLVNKASYLEHISIGDCVDLTNNGLDALAENCPNLKTLIINEAEYSKCNVTDSGLQKVAEHCKGIKVLKMVHCDEIGDVGLQAFSEACQDLSVLEAAGCTAITDGAILSLIHNCPNIATLDLGHCVQLTSASINKVFTVCRSLRHLNLETCHRLSDLDMETEKSTVIPICFDESSTKTQSLTTEEIHIDIDHQEVGIFNHDNTKETLNERNEDCDSHGNQYLDPLARSFNWHSHIRTLNLGFCSKISNHCVNQIAKYCPDLRNLNLQGCSMVTNAGVLAIVQGCTYLKKLNISGGSVFQTSRLTDDCLFHIANHCNYLTKLTIIKNYHITTEGVFQVIKSCNSIEEISFASSRTNTTSGIKPESLTRAAGEVQDRTLCIKIIGNNAKVFVTKDPEYKLKAL